MNIHISTTALLLGVAKADEIIDSNELESIQTTQNNQQSIACNTKSITAEDINEQKITSI